MLITSWVLQSCIRYGTRFVIFQLLCVNIEKGLIVVACHKSNQVWSGNQDFRQIHRLAVKRSVRNISCSTNALCQSIAVTASIVVAWHSKQTITSLSPVSCGTERTYPSSLRHPTPAPSSCHGWAGNPLLLFTFCQFLSYPLHLFWIAYLWFIYFLWLSLLNRLFKFPSFVLFMQLFKVNKLFFVWA